jgi:NhaP-type Na+/H+ or K+/H+ antiporter
MMALLGMVIGIVGIVLLSRLHEARWASQRQAGLH